MANPNPSPETRFQPGSTPNPGGKSKEQKRLELEAAEMAAKLRHAMLSSMMEKLKLGEDATDLMTGDALRLFKDSEDRAFGSPKAEVEAKIDANVNVSADATFIDIAARMERLAARAAGGNLGADDVAGDGTA